jgi:HK97 family phage portal protein
LLARPNPAQCQPELLEAWYGFLLVAGNAYLEAVTIGGAVRELHVLRPDRMTVVPGSDGWPSAYDYTVSGRTLRYHQDADPLRPILHQSFFHPLSDHYGLSPIEPAATSIDLHNAASTWNKALLDNAARPSGALVYAPGSGGHLTREQFDRLKAELEQSFQGPRNAGRPMLLEGGLDWKAMALSPKDMDFIEAKNAAAREVALAFGVPPMLLGIPGDNTFANYAEANRVFWRQAVVPMLGRVTEALGNWLGPMFGAEALRIMGDLDQVEALSADRDALWARMGAAAFLTDAEKRDAVGYGRIANSE